MRPSALAQWHAIAQSRDAAALDALLADDVVFVSPVVHKPQVGKALTKAYLAAALERARQRNVSLCRGMDR